MNSGTHRNTRAGIHEPDAGRIIGEGLRTSRQHGTHRAGIQFDGAVTSACIGDPEIAKWQGFSTALLDTVAVAGVDEII